MYVIINSLHKHVASHPVIVNKSSAAGQMVAQLTNRIFAFEQGLPLINALFLSNL